MYIVVIRYILHTVRAILKSGTRRMHVFAIVRVMYSTVSG